MNWRAYTWKKILLQSSRAPIGKIVPVGNFFFFFTKPIFLFFIEMKCHAFYVFHSLSQFYFFWVVPLKNVSIVYLEFLTYMPNIFPVLYWCEIFYESSTKLLIRLIIWNIVWVRHMSWVFFFFFLGSGQIGLIRSLKHGVKFDLAYDKFESKNKKNLRLILNERNLKPILLACEANMSGPKLIHNDLVRMLRWASFERPMGNVLPASCFF